MDNQNKNDTDKAIIKLGNIFKVFALIVTILIIALAVYLASNAEPKFSSNTFEINHYALRTTHYALTFIL
ncbi:MAG: hypothetical protein IJU91_03030 [Selenomonadaceae bacterium]|nr:hypothetical protein [Selenomonadaceae bacterium]